MAQDDNEDREKEPDVVLLCSPTADGEGVNALRARKNRVELAEIRPLKEGQPVVAGEVARLKPREEMPGVCDVEVTYEVPRPPTQEEIQTFGAAADAIVQKWLDKVGQPKGAGFFTSPYKLEPGLYAFADSHYEIPSARSGIDRRNYGSVQFLFSTPSDFSIRPLAGFRMTMVYQIQTGTPYNYTPPTGPFERRNSPVTTITDVNLERDFHFGKNRVATGFMEIRNLWGQKDDLTVGFNWVQYGLQMPIPGDSKYATYGDISELSRYSGMGRPRRIVLGARVKF